MLLHLDQVKKDYNKITSRSTVLSIPLYNNVPINMHSHLELLIHIQVFVTKLIFFVFLIKASL